MIRWLPHPLWICLTAVAVVGLRFGIVMYQHQVLIRKIERLGGQVAIRPYWLVEFTDKEPAKLFGSVLAVFLGQSDVTDADVGAICNLDSLKHLVVDRTRVSDTAMQHVGRLQNLRSLELFDTQITDAGLARLKHLPSLVALDLRSTRTTDAGIEHVSCLRKLEHLALDETDVTDASIPLLLRLPNLRELSLRGTRVSEDGVRELESAIPGLKVTR